MGNSGQRAPAPNESRFVADETFGELDVRHPVTASGDVVTVSISTTRVVGTVDPDGFLAKGPMHLDQGTLAPTMRLSIEAEIRAIDFGGELGHGALDVEAFLHKDTNHERSLGHLQGPFGSGWREYQLTVKTVDLRFPPDPCPLAGLQQDLCGRDPEAASNKISFLFTGAITTGMNMTFEVDWMALEPEDKPGLAWRPVLLVSGWNIGSEKMGPGTAWTDGLSQRDVSSQVAADVAPLGTISGNAARIAPYVSDLCRRFGVQRINVVGYDKGGLDARHYVKDADDVDTLIMLGTPNAGNFTIDAAVLAASPVASVPAEPLLAYADAQEMTTWAMALYNRFYTRNRQTRYVAAAAAYDSVLATFVYGPVVGFNDEVVSVDSALFALPYAVGGFYQTSTTDAVSQGVCASENVLNHSCLRHNTAIFDDLFKGSIATLTPPPQPPRIAPEGPSVTPAEAAAELRTVLTGAAPNPADGVTDTYSALVDVATAAVFTVITDGEAIGLQLVSPGGTRIDPATTSPGVIHVPAADAGPFWYTAYRIDPAEAGAWTAEVTGIGSASPDSGYALAAFMQLPAGAGVTLDGQIADLCGVGLPATITGTLGSDGVPVTGASVTATVKNPDRTGITELDLVEAGDGRYSADFTPATPGLHTVALYAQGTDPAFSREQLLVTAAVPGLARFTGAVSDAGVDTDDDGRFDQLVVDVGLEVDVAGAYALYATLIDAGGTAIEQVRLDVQLDPGPQSVPLAFAGDLVYANGSDGPYLVDDLLIADGATGTGLALGPVYQTASYARTDFQRPPLVLTGTVTDQGAHFVHMEQMPYEELVISVEVDLAVAADLTATATLSAEDGTFVAGPSAFASLEAGVGAVEFHVPAHSIFNAGQPGPYTLRTLSLSGNAPDGSPVSFREPGVITVTQPYLLDDFAPSPRFTVGGTVTGLSGAGQLELQLSCEGPPGTPATTRIRPGNGTFTFAFPTLVGGNPYQVTVSRQPAEPPQICTVANAAGTIEEGNVTDVIVTCE
jgi:hypothetical protein